MGFLRNDYIPRITKAFAWWCRMKGHPLQLRPSIKSRFRWSIGRAWFSVAGRGDVSMKLLGVVLTNFAYIATILVVLTIAGEKSGIVGEMWPHLMASTIWTYLKWSAVASVLIVAFNLLGKTLWNFMVDEPYRWWEVQKYNSEHDTKAEVEEAYLYGGRAKE